MENDKKKRERAPNFTELETRFLVDIALKYHYIVENKKTSDAVSWKDKQGIWDTIAEEFNARTGSTNRTAKVFRLKYDGVKQNIKKKQTKNKVEIFKTGGGTAKTQQLTDYEEKLLGYVYLSVNGLPTQFDSDIAVVGTPTPSSLSDVNVGAVSTADGYVDINVDVVKADNLLDISSTSIAGPAVLAEYRASSLNEEVGACNNGVGDPTSEIVDKTDNATLQDWSSWSPALLRQKKHDALVKKKVTKTTLNSKIDNIADARNSLIQLQADVAKNEMKQKEQQCEMQKVFHENQVQWKEREHELQMEILELQKKALIQDELKKEEEHALKIELLQLEIKNKKADLLIKQKQGL